MTRRHTINANVADKSNPETEKHVDGAVGKSRHMTDWSRRREHTIGPSCNFDGKIAHRVQITAVGHAEWCIEPHQGTGVGPVDHLVGDQVFVRDQIFLAVSAASEA